MSLVRRACVAFGITALVAGSAGMWQATAAGETPAFTKTETISRVNLVDGTDKVVDKRDVTVTVSDTNLLRDRQPVVVSWSGAHPTGGLVADHNSAAAARQEYPVVIMQCRGVDSATAPAAQRLSPQTCWTQTPGERFQYSQSGFLFPPYRMDRYATTTDRAFSVDQPDPLPGDCSPVSVPHWVPFVAVDGHAYPGGILGCGGMAPEAANAADALQPGNTTYGVTDAKGAGSAKFVIQTDETNASLGCSATVACSLVVIPIVGISCDPAGTAQDAPDHGMPAAKRPPSSLVPDVLSKCAKTGHFPAGSYNGGSEDPDLPVSGELWWAASNWRNRVSVPLTFAPSASACNVVDKSDATLLYGSEAMLQATQQWAPHFCLDSKLFTLRHVQTSEPQAKNLLRGGLIQAALQGAPPSAPFDRPTVQAPVAVTGFAIAYSVDGADGNPYPNLRLNARLLAKLLSESYRSCAQDCLDFKSGDAVTSGFAQLAGNPIDMSRDPEFKALNPGVPNTNYLQSAAALAVMASDSDVMHAVSSYIDADPEARSWLNGTPDPWGMVVNPAYKNMALPVDNWPLLDSHLVHLGTGANQCLVANPVPWLPLVAAPVSNPATVALNMQFDIANSQVNCKNNGQQDQKLAGLGRQAPGERFLVGLVSLADAMRYRLATAQLQSHNDGPGVGGKFSDASGRSFAGPTTAALQAAASLLTADDALGTWVLPYDKMRTAANGSSAYPGTMLMSADVPVSGLPKADAARYAAFLRFAAGPGQTAGFGIGQLPPGYLPMTAAGGLGAFAAYTQVAADEVEKQSGRVPAPSNPKPAATPKAPKPAVHRPAPAPVISVPTSGPIAVAGASPTTAPKPKAAPSSATTSAPTTVAAVPVARTGSLSAGPLGLALPVLALLGFVSLGTAAWMSGVGRR